MIEFKNYESKPITRSAFQLTDQLEWCLMRDSTWVVSEKSDPVTTTNVIKFKAYEDPKLGDWVVRLTDSDTYHCTDAVFRERNIIPA